MERGRGGHCRVRTGAGGRWGWGTVASHQSDLFTPTPELFPRVLVEHNGLRVLVHHLSHVSQDVLLGDDAQETPEHREGEGTG